MISSTPLSSPSLPLPPQIINGTDILEVLHDYPELSQFVHSLYYCHYDDFFRSLSEDQLDTFDTICTMTVH